MGRRFQLVIEVHIAVGRGVHGSHTGDMYVAELATHAWDLARATGQFDKLEPSLAWPALEGHGP